MSKPLDIVSDIMMGGMGMPMLMPPPDMGGFNTQPGFGGGNMGGGNMGGFGGGGFNTMGPGGYQWGFWNKRKSFFVF